MEYEGDPTEIPSKSSLPPASGALGWVGYSTPGPWEAPGGGSVCKALTAKRGWVMQIGGMVNPTIGDVHTRVALSSEPVGTRSESLSSELSIFLTIRAINSPIFSPEGEVP